MIRKLSFSESHSILQSGERVALLDVREEPEYITGHVAGAELLPVDEITAETAAELIPSTKSMTRNPGRAADPRVLSPGRTCRLEREAE